MSIKTVPEFHLHDTAVLKKPHPCGENRWEITRVGADIKLKCMGCGHVIMLDRADFCSSLKRIIVCETDKERE